jgi:hypothetical protein
MGRRVARLVEPYEADLPACEGDGRLELQAFPVCRHDTGGANLPEHRLDRASTHKRPDPERFISSRPQDEDDPDVARRYVVPATATIDFPS